MRHYDSANNLVRSDYIDQGGPDTISTTWQQNGGRFTTPSNGAKVSIQLWIQLGSGWVTYDDVSLRPVVTYNLSYDAENRLSGVSGAATATFVYDGDGRRVKATAGGVTTTYIGDYLEWTGSTTTMVKYYYAGATRVAMRVGSNNPKWLLSDHLGSQSIVASYDGLTEEGELRYRAWGETRYTSGTTPTKRQYTGQLSEMASIGLYFYGARFYDPALSRFTSADSIIPGAGDVQAWDRYAYSYGNPVKYIDPDGHWPCSFSSSGFSCSISTFGLGAAVNRVGERLGVENASDIVSGAMSNIGLGLDIAAGAVDFASSAIVTTGIVVGATGGAVITLPGGGTAVVTGAAGASVGWATAELGVKPLILAGNALASLATLATVSSDLISGDTGFESALGISAEGVEMSSQVAIGSASQVSTWATAAGWISPLAYPSLGIQTVAILGDLGVVSPPPISIGLTASFPKEPKAEFRLKFGDLEVR